MLSVEVYKRIYEMGRDSGGDTLVEIGTAHGAATVALALGAQVSGRVFHVFTADPFGGALSSRSAYGSVADNVAIVRRNLEHFGVSDHVTITIGSVSSLLDAHDLHGVSALLLDADGRIDRDLAALFDRLMPRCPIVIDDIDGQLYVATIGGRRILDQKHRIGRMLSEALVDAEVLVPVDQIGATGFFLKGDARPDVIPDVAIPAYRGLVFADLDSARAAGDPSWQQFVIEHIPGARTLYRRIRSHRGTRCSS